MSDNSIYKAPSSNVDAVEIEKPRASLLLKSITIVLALIGALLCGSFYLLKSHSFASSVGGAIGGAWFWPLVIVGLFQIGRSYRNQRSRYKIFAWSELVIIIIWILSILMYLPRLVTQ
jgi:hypothetical protein